MSALGGLAQQKWAEARERRKEGERAAAAAQPPRADVPASAPFNLGYGSDSDSGSGGESAERGALRYQLEAYGSGSEDEEDAEGDAGTHSRGERGTMMSKQAETPQREGVRSGSADRHGDQRDAACSPAKRRKQLPQAVDALASAAPAVSELLALQPKEPSQEEQRASLHAAQAKRIEELFFWSVSLPALHHNFKGLDFRLTVLFLDPSRKDDMKVRNYA